MATMAPQMMMRRLIAPTVRNLVGAAKRGVNAEGDHHQDRGDKDRDRKPYRPALPREQPDAGRDIGEAGDEIEPRHEEDRIADSGARLHAAEERPSARDYRQKTEESGEDGATVTPRRRS